MKSLTLFSLMLLACQGEPPAKPGKAPDPEKAPAKPVKAQEPAKPAKAAESIDAPVKPAKPLDPADPLSVLDHASYNTRTQKSYETKFKAQLTTSGAPLNYDGSCVWVNPGVIFVHYTASGGDEKMIVRTSLKDAWLFHPLAGVWATADQMGMPGAARGIQNPDEVLAVVARHPGTAKLVKPGVVELTFGGADIEAVMKEQTSKDAFDWKESSATLTLTIDAENRLQSFTCGATLKSTAAGVKEKIHYTAEVTVVAFNGARSLQFLDEKKRVIPLSSDMKAGIESVLKEKQ
jgi:hypothetical protein